MNAAADVLRGVVSVALTVVVLVRWRLVLRPGGMRALWFALLALTPAQWLSLSAINLWVSGWVGSSGFVPVLRQSLGALAAVGVLCLLASLNGVASGWRSRHVLIGALCVGLSMGPWLAWPPLAAPSGWAAPQDFYGPTWQAWVHYAGFLAVLGAALGGAVLLAVRHGRVVPLSPATRGLQLIGVGCAVGFGYVLLKLGMQLLWAVGRGEPYVIWDQVLETLILGISLSCIMIGTTYNAVHLHFNDTRAAWARAAADRRALRGVEPLWSALVSTYPAIRLPQLTTRLPRGSREVRLLLMRRVMEIHDGLLHAHRSVTSDEVDEVVVLLPGDGEPAVRRAAALAAVAVLAPRPDVWTNRAVRPSPWHAEESLDAEVAWLVGVSEVFASMVAALSVVEAGEVAA